MKRRKVNKHAIRYASQKVSEGSYIYDQQYGGQNIWDPLDKRIVWEYPKVCVNLQTDVR